MDAFWWFKENEIAGFARPGFNCTHWFDYPFDEAIIMSWLGQHNSGKIPLTDLKRHLVNYTPKVLPFYRLTETAEEIAEKYMQPEVIETALARVMDRTKKLAGFEVNEDHVLVEFCDERLGEEIDFLKSKGITRVVSLTEQHLNSEKLADHFSLHHFSINDMGAPSVEQAEELAKIIQTTRDNNEVLGVHCMAGIGRTTTMIVSAHLILGSTLEEMKAHVASKNPKFQFVGSQAKFMEDIARQFSSIS